MHKYLITSLFLIWSMSANCSDLFSDQFDGERALKHIQNQVEFGPRILSNPEAKKQTLDYMEEHLRYWSCIPVRAEHQSSGTVAIAAIDSGPDIGAV